MSVAIRLEALRKEYGDVVAVDDLDLEIPDGEFFSMLGPSGSGKTTVLRMVAGFEQPTAGRVWLQGEDVTRRAPFERDVNTVFQDYALFPHLSVRENVEYGLRVKKVPKAERRTRTQEALETVRLGEYGARRPSQLSGGQRQRVALARALVNRPRVLLLDEPLGALDLKLRREMQIELKEMQREVGITFVFVTHDQEEALTMSDRIAVFHNGRVEQVATPVELYEHPSTSFVAGFVGTSNLITGEVAQATVGSAQTFSVRPEKIHLHPADAVAPNGAGAANGATVTVPGRVVDVVYLGSATHSLVEVGHGQATAVLTVMQQNLESSLDHALARRGEQVQLSWQREHMIQLGNTTPGNPTSKESS